MIHNLLITTRNGHIIFAKYFDGSTREQRVLWESTLYTHTKQDWSAAKENDEQVAILGNKFVVFSGTEDLLFFITGSEEYDELTLQEILRNFITILRDVLKKNLNEDKLLEHYSKVCLVCDEMINQGVLEYCDKDTIKKMIKMKLES